MCKLVNKVLRDCVVLFSGKKGYEVLIQGGVIDDVARYMVEQYGVPKRCIEVLDKTSRK